MKALPQVHLSAETDDNPPVSELMSLDHEGPSTKATRKLDWQELFAPQDRNNRRLLAFIAGGCAPKETAGKLK